MSDEIMDLSTVAQETAEPTETIETDPVESNDAEIDSVENDNEDFDSESSEGTEETDESSTNEKSAKGKKTDLIKTKFEKLPENYKKMFKEDPALKQMFFENQQYAKVFESPKVAAQIAEQIDLYGGIETITNDLKEMSTIDTMFQAGDSAVLDVWTKMSPDGFSKIMPDAIVKYSNMDPEGWEHMSSRILAQSFDQANLVGAIQQLYRDLDPNSQAAKLVENIYNNYLSPIYQSAKNGPKQKAENPEKTKLQSERQQFELQKQEAFVGDVCIDTNRNLTECQNRELAPYIKGKNLDKEQLKMLHSNIDARFKKLLEKDSLAQEQMSNILRSGDKAKFLKYMQSKIDKYMPEATRQVWRAFTGVKSEQMKASTKSAQNKVQSGPIRVDRVPRPDQIDQQASIKYAKGKGLTYQQLINKGIVVLKNGKVVKFED